MASLEERLQDLDKKRPAQQGQAKLKTALEEELAGEDDDIASQLRRTRAQEIIATRQKRIEQLTGANSGGGAPAAERREGVVEQSLTDIAAGLLEKGMDPAAVGRLVDYMIGSRTPNMYGLPGMPPPAQQGMTFADMKEIFKMGQDVNKSDPTLTAILQELKDKVVSLESRMASPPRLGGAIMVQQPDGQFVKVASSDETVIIPRTDTGTAGIETEKEKNRHAEEMAKLQEAKEHHDGIRNILASIPEQIGEGLAARTESSAAAPVTRAPARQTAATAESPAELECEDCHTKITIPVGAKSVKCPKCGATYNAQ